MLLSIFETLALIIVFATLIAVVINGIAVSFTNIFIPYGHIY